MDAMKLLGSLLKNQSLSSGLGQQLLGGLLGGGQSQQRSSGGGLGGILGSVLGGGGAQQSSGGGAADLLGSILGGGGRRQAAQAPAGGNLIGSILGSVLGGGGGQQQATPPIPQEHHAAANDQAVLMIRAMVNAAKADGRVDNTEQEKIIGKLGAEVSQDEINFLKSEFAAPLDVKQFADSVPNGLEPQVYALSLTSIELDTQSEAQYLGQLAQHMELDPQICNQIHDQVGAPKIFG
jgi:uncharacterized membrane protein YebE (DUF533 family)